VQLAKAAIYQALVEKIEAFQFKLSQLSDGHPECEAIRYLVVGEKVSYALVSQMDKSGNGRRGKSDRRPLGHDISCHSPGRSG
jgi:hypothetical protein